VSFEASVEAGTGDGVGTRSSRNELVSCEEKDTGGTGTRPWQAELMSCEENDKAGP
jgi:hypothetical protein